MGKMNMAVDNQIAMKGKNKANTKEENTHP